MKHSYFIRNFGKLFSAEKALCVQSNFAGCVQVECISILSYVIHLWDFDFREIFQNIYLYYIYLLVYQLGAFSGEALQRENCKSSEYGFLQVLQLLSRTTIKSTMIDMNHRKFILIFVKLQGGFTTH